MSATEHNTMPESEFASFYGWFGEQLAPLAVPGHQGATSVMLARLSKYFLVDPPRMYLDYLRNFGSNNGGFKLVEEGLSDVDSLVKFSQKNQDQLLGLTPPHCNIIGVRDGVAGIALYSPPDAVTAHDLQVVEFCYGSICVAIASGFRNYLYLQGYRYVLMSRGLIRKTLMCWNRDRFAEAVEIAKSSGFGVEPFTDQYQFAGTRDGSSLTVTINGDGLRFEIFSRTHLDADVVVAIFKAFFQEIEGRHMVLFTAEPLSNLRDYWYDDSSKETEQTLDDLLRFWADTRSSDRRVYRTRGASPTDVQQLARYWRSRLPALYTDLLLCLGDDAGVANFAIREVFAPREIVRFYQGLIEDARGRSTAICALPAFCDALTVRNSTACRVLCNTNDGSFVATWAGGDRLQPYAESVRNWLYRRAYISSFHAARKNQALDLSPDALPAVKEILLRYGLRPLFFSDAYQHAAHGLEGSVVISENADEHRLFLCSKNTAWSSEVLAALLSIDDVFSSSISFGETDP